GFFPGNLKDFHPAIPSAFVNPDSVQLIAPPESSTFRIIFHCMQMLHVLFFATGLVIIAKRIFKKGIRNLNLTGDFFYLAFFISAAISAVLIILSVTVGKEENIPGHWWSYVEEPRYYGMIHVFVHLGIFILYWQLRSKDLKLARTIFIATLILILPEIIRGAFFIVNRVTKA